MQKVIFKDLGLIEYNKAWKCQEEIFNEVVNAKKERRENPEKEDQVKHYLLFCEHPHVYTLGRSGNENHLLLSSENLKRKEATFVKINRGGDITYHGPGQIVGYPIFDLDFFFTDIHKYLRYLEESIILTLKEYNLEAGRIKGLTGVWLDWDNPLKARKISAMGIRCSRWVTMHGFAFNVNTDLSYFHNIIPCGITDKAVTSMQKELGYEVNMDEVKKVLSEKISELFQIKLVTV